LQEEELVGINPVNQGLLYLDSQVMTGQRIMQALADKGDKGAKGDSGKGAKGSKGDSGKGAKGSKGDSGKGDTEKGAKGDSEEAPTKDEGATPSTVNEVTSDKDETKTSSTSKISNAFDGAVSSCSSSHVNGPGCRTKWSKKETWDPFPDRIGEYKEKAWVIPEITTHAVPPAGITNDTMIQL
jgi:hypothetical protein